MTKSINIGKRIIELSSCHSTNDEVLERIKAGESSEGDVLMAKEQLKGRGQKGNVWETEKDKNLTVSFVLEPYFLRPEFQYELTVVSSLAIVSFLKGKGITASIKWPNDIYVNNQKIAGILIENKIKGTKLSYSVVGIGLNVNQQQFDLATAVSMNMLTGEKYSIMELLLELSSFIQQYYIELKKGIDLRTFYKELLIGKDSPILFDDGEQFRSLVVDVDDHGCLVLSKNGELKKYGVKEVKFLEL